MKKKIKSCHINLLPLRLYLNDIELIENILKEYCEEFVIETELADFYFDTTQELKTIQLNELTNMKISTTNPHIQIHITNSSFFIDSTSNEPHVLGIIEKIKSILLKHNSYFSRVFHLKDEFFPFLILNFSCIFLLCTYSSYNFNDKVTLSNCIFIVFWFAWIIRSFLFPCHSKVFLTDRSSISSYKSKTFQVLKKFFWLIVSAIISFLLGKYGNIFF